MSEPDERLETLIEALLRESEEMDADFTGWLEREAPRWHALGHDEAWIRLRMEAAQAMRKLNRLMKAQGLSEAQRREALRAGFADMPARSPATAAAPPDEVQHAMAVLGAEIGATIFEVSSTLSREQFLVRVDFLIQHQFGQEFLSVQSVRARFTHEHLVTFATQEYKRLGGVLVERRRQGKQKRLRKPREK